MNKQITKAQLGAIGEMRVASMLMQKGWDAFIANMTINNNAKYDLICVNPNTSERVLIQVKTSIRSSFPVGLSLGDAASPVLEEKIVGPWIFVYAQGEGTDMTFKYFILSRSQMIMLTRESNDWYINKWHRDKPVNLNNPCALKLAWLSKGYDKSSERNSRYEAFVNPLVTSSENQWDSIWAK